MNKKRKSYKVRQIGGYYLQKGEYQKSIKIFLKSIGFNNSRAFFSESVYHDIAYCYENIGDYMNAEAYILKSLEISPGYINAKIFLGNLYKNMGNIEQGEKILEECEKTEQSTLNMKLDLDGFYKTK